jgi:hypothetical protein
MGDLQDGREEVRGYIDIIYGPETIGGQRTFRFREDNT